MKFPPLIRKIGTAIACWGWMAAGPLFLSGCVVTADDMGVGGGVGVAPIGVVAPTAPTVVSVGSPVVYSRPYGWRHPYGPVYGGGWRGGHRDFHRGDRHHGGDHRHHR